MKEKTRKFLSEIWEIIEYGAKYFCLKLSPLKRLITVLIIGGTLAAANIYFIASSIYSMGKRDAEKQFLKIQHIETQNQLKIKN